MNELKIDTSEEFPHLSRAPIVEAVIDIRTRASVPWERDNLIETLRNRLPEYPRVLAHNQKQMVLPAPFNVGQAKETDTWKGLRLESADQRQIVSFTRDGFSFSRLKPYQNWQQLRQEALRLWKIHSDVAKPTEVQRIGLRYINRIDLPLPPEPIHFGDYIEPCPLTPEGLDLPFTGFLHVDTLCVPDYKYSINIVRTIQPAPSPMVNAGLILDIEVFSLETQLAGDYAWIVRSFTEMRWLKNKAFFGGITQKALEYFISSAP